MDSPPPPQSRRRQQPLLHDDAIVEILSWLPVKTLLQLRCVCRSWKSIISDPKLVKLHHQRSPKNTNIILTLPDFDEEKIGICGFAVPCSVRSLLSFPPSSISKDVCYPLNDEIWVLGSCNGLVCLASPSENPNECWFRFWNPATRITSNTSPSLVGLMNSHFGFGYDYSTDTYKVFAILTDKKAKEDSQTLKVKICSMGDTCWRDAGSFPALPLQGRTGNENDGVYISGTLSWLALRNFSVGDVTLGPGWEDVTTLDRLVIISVDIGKEIYKHLLLPSGLDEVPLCKPVLGILMDSLMITREPILCYGK